MSRNKYPEATVEKILEISQRLFLEKGYDQTSIQDIVNELGLTKGAIYHHFKSKEDIMNALSVRMFFHNNPFEAVKKRTDLNALEKIKLVIKLNQSNEEQVELTNQAIPILNNPYILAKMIESNRQVLCPYWLELIEEGQKDGSIQTEYPKQLSELLVLLDLWFIPSVFPVNNKEEILQRYYFLSDIFTKMGLPIYDDELGGLVESLPYFNNEEK